MRAFALGLKVGVAFAIGLGAQASTARSPLAPSASLHRVARQAAPDADPDVTTIYRGTLGDALIQLSVYAKSEDEPGEYGGEYFVFGGGQTILLAGEISDEKFFLEESEDGQAISGWWDGHFVVDGNRAYIVGQWQSADETHTRPFKLERVMRTRAALKRAM